MGRKLRYIPDGGALVEVTCRTLHGRLLLRPSPELDDIADIAAGILGRAQRLYPVELIWYSRRTTTISSSGRRTRNGLRNSPATFNSNLAREVGRLTDWTGKIWERRYQAIVISDEEEAQVARFRYVLAHGVKENLVARLRDWPGLHCIHQLADGEPLTGTWYDRTQQYLARRKGEDADPAKHATTETVTFSPLPCWKHLSPEAYQERVAKMGLEIEGEAAARRKRTGAEPFGAAKILAQAPRNPSSEGEEVACPAPPRGEQGDPSDLLRGLRPVRRRLPSGDGEALEGRPQPGLPAGLLPTRAAVRGQRVDRVARVRSEERVVERLEGGRRGEVCSERRFRVRFRKSMSHDERSGEGEQALQGRSPGA
jgi:hypothetical protein